MAKKKSTVVKETLTTGGVEKVFSEKYQCLLTKEFAFFDDTCKSWLNKDIEMALKNNKK